MKYLFYILYLILSLILFVCHIVAVCSLLGYRYGIWNVSNIFRSFPRSLAVFTFLTLCSVSQYRVISILSVLRKPALLLFMILNSLQQVTDLMAKFEIMMNIFYIDLKILIFRSKQIPSRAKKIPRHRKPKENILTSMESKWNHEISCILINRYLLSTSVLKSWTRALTVSFTRSPRQRGGAMCTPEIFVDCVESALATLWLLIGSLTW